MSESWQDRPRTLVYGEYWMHECFAILDLGYAEALSKEIASIKACTTVGQARRLKPILELTSMPDGEFEDDDGEPLADDAIYAWAETAAVNDGDWPPMPDAIALDDLPIELLRELADRTGAGVVETVFNGPYLAIPLDREADLIATVHSAGYELHRDDALIASIGTET